MEGLIIEHVTILNRCFEHVYGFDLALSSFNFFVIVPKVIIVGRCKRVGLVSSRGGWNILCFVLALQTCRLAWIDTCEGAFFSFVMKQSQETS